MLRVSCAEGGATTGVALPPEDAVLIQVGAAETPEVKKKKANVREKPSTSVSWLRRHTEYISDYEQSTKKVSRADSIEARYPTTRPDPTNTPTLCARTHVWRRSV